MIIISILNMEHQQLQNEQSINPQINKKEHKLRFRQFKNIILNNARNKFRRFSRCRHIGKELSNDLKLPDDDTNQLIPEEFKDCNIFTESFDDILYNIYISNIPCSISQIFPNCVLSNYTYSKDHIQFNKASICHTNLFLHFEKPRFIIDGVGIIVVIQGTVYCSSPFHGVVVVSDINLNISFIFADIQTTYDESFSRLKTLKDDITSSLNNFDNSELHHKFDEISTNSMIYYGNTELNHNITESVEEAFIDTFGEYEEINDKLNRILQIKVNP